jgi:LacI family gluconate utilization system Gnt-I transcriptional repressor
MVATVTVERVRAAIARTGYVPNRIAGGLASRRTGLIAVIVPSIVHSVFNDTIQAMTEELVKAGHQVMLGLSGYGAGDVSGMLDSILSRRPDGIILTGFAGVADVRRRLRAMKIPVIETWDLPPNHSTWPSVSAPADRRSLPTLCRRAARRPLAVYAGPRSTVRRGPSAPSSRATDSPLRAAMACQCPAPLPMAVSRWQPCSRARIVPTSWSAAPTGWPWV